MHEHDDDLELVAEADDPDLTDEPMISFLDLEGEPVVIRPRRRMAGRPGPRRRRPLRRQRRATSGPRNREG